MSNPVRAASLRFELRDAWIGEGNAKQVTFRRWLQNMAENPRGTLQEAAQEYLKLVPSGRAVPKRKEQVNAET